VRKSIPVFLVRILLGKTSLAYGGGGAAVASATADCATFRNLSLHAPRFALGFHNAPMEDVHAGLIQVNITGLDGINILLERRRVIEDAGLADSTAIIVTAKHGQSPIDPNRVTRIPSDVPTGKAPSDVLGGIGTGLVGGGLVGQAREDVSLIWPTDPTKVASSVALLEKNEAVFGGGEIFWGRSLEAFVGNSEFDSRVPDIIVAPNVGVTYTGGTKKIAEHGGSASDDRNVMMLVSNNRMSPRVVNGQVETRQVAPTILKLLGLDPNALQTVRKEGTEVLPYLPY
jgi:hypothetical protein